MANGNLDILGRRGVAFAAIFLSASAWAQSPLKAIDGKSIPLASTHFSARPIFCDDGDCTKATKLDFGDICKVAKCLPLDAKAITKVIGLNVVHWRIQKSKGTMAQFIGDTQLTSPVAAQTPSVLASASDLARLPVIGMKGPKGKVLQYWVVVD